MESDLDKRESGVSIELEAACCATSRTPHRPKCIAELGGSIVDESVLLMGHGEKILS